ncbi:MAG: non-hydrolyzing UDP-N-acetylglucosamine 2-epimerase [Vicinamibacterales bacterium]
MKVLCVLGTRPEAIKLAPVIRELARRAECASVRVCVTAQHREMLDQMLEGFEIRPDYDLDLMRDGQSLAGVSSAVLAALDPVIDGERPDWVLVQGDTTTAMVASLAAFYRRVRLGHVEAGLRTHDRQAPFPEEINRRIADLVADRHFAPTERARENLLREGVVPASIVVTGNTVVDALRWTSGRPVPDSIDRLVDPSRRLVLVTAHRRESFGAPIEEICHAVRELSARYPGDLQIVYPVHRNPQIAGPVDRLLAGVPGVELVAPVDYLALVHLMKRAHVILTDSGGIQEEAPYLGVPVLVLRDATERPEAVECGAARLVGTTRARIVEETARLLDDPAARAAMAAPASPFGDGHAAERIVDALLA